jgi:hypothetical protein
VFIGAKYQSKRDGVKKILIEKGYIVCEPGQLVVGALIDDLAQTVTVIFHGSWFNQPDSGGDSQALLQLPPHLS